MYNCIGMPNFSKTLICLAFGTIIFSKQLFGSWAELKINVVRIEDEVDKNFYGTAFKIAEDEKCQYFVTNFHVFSNQSASLLIANYYSQTQFSKPELIASFPGYDLSFFCLKQEIQNGVSNLSWLYSKEAFQLKQTQLYTGGTVGFPGSKRYNTPFIAYIPSVYSSSRYRMTSDYWTPYRRSDSYLYDGSSGFHVETTTQCPMPAAEACLRVPFSFRGFSGSPFIATEIGESRHQVIGIVSHYDPLLPFVYLVPIDVTMRLAEKAINDYLMNSSQNAMINEIVSDYIFIENSDCLNIKKSDKQFKICALPRLLGGGGAVGLGGGGAVGLGGGGAVGLGGGGAINLEVIDSRVNIPGIIHQAGKSGFGNYLLKGSLDVAQKSLASIDWSSKFSWLDHILNANEAFRGALNILKQSAGVAVQQEDGRWREAFYLSDAPVNTLQEVVRKLRSSNNFKVAYEFTPEAFPQSMKFDATESQIGSLRVMEVSGAANQSCLDGGDPKNCPIIWASNSWWQKSFAQSHLQRKSDGTFNLAITQIGEYGESLSLSVPKFEPIGPGDFMFIGELFGVMNVYSGAGLEPIKMVWGKVAAGGATLKLKSIIRISRNRESNMYRVSGLVILPPNFSDISQTPFEMKVLSFSSENHIPM